MTLKFEENIIMIPDIQREKPLDEKYVEPGDKYTFTDGCGNISFALSEKINEKFGL